MLSKSIMVVFSSILLFSPPILHPPPLLCCFSPSILLHRSCLLCFFSLFSLFLVFYSAPISLLFSFIIIANLLLFPFQSPSCFFPPSVSFIHILNSAPFPVLFCFILLPYSSTIISLFSSVALCSPFRRLLFSPFLLFGFYLLYQVHFLVIM